MMNRIFKIYLIFWAVLIGARPLLAWGNDGASSSLSSPSSSSSSSSSLVGHTLVTASGVEFPEYQAQTWPAEELAAYPVFTSPDTILREQAASVIIARSDNNAVQHLRLRGGSASQTVILEDDLPRFNVTSSDNVPDLLGFSRQGLRKMALLEGPQSARYAPSAAQGVLLWSYDDDTWPEEAPPELKQHPQKSTRPAKSKRSWSAAIQVASHETFKESLALAQDPAGTSWFGEAFYQRTDRRGISQAARGSERDGQKLNFGQITWGHQSKTLRWSVGGRIWEDHLDLDGGWPLQDSADEARKSHYFFRGQMTWRPHASWKHHWSGEFQRGREIYQDSWGGAQMHGQQIQSAWRSTWKEGAWQVEFGHYARKEQFTDLHQEQQQQHLFGWGRYALTEQGTISYGLRFVWASQTSPVIVQQAAAAYEMKGGTITWRPHMAWGTAVKHPSLFQKYDYRWGNKDLALERSWQSEAGLAAEGQKIKADVTGFYGKLNQAIGFWENKYFNLKSPRPNHGMVGRGEYKGATFKLGLSAAAFFGPRLPATPKTQVRLALAVPWAEYWQAKLAYQYEGTRNDGQHKLKAYHYVSCAVIYAKQGWQIEGRIENLFKQKYEQQYGYNVDQQSFSLTAQKQGLF